MRLKGIDCNQELSIKAVCSVDFVTRLVSALFGNYKIICDFIARGGNSSNFGVQDNYAE